MVKWLNAAREARGMTIPEFADKLGMIEEEYAEFEAGDGQEIIDNANLLYKIADALDASPADCFTMMFNEKAERAKAESAEKPTNWLSETAAALQVISYNITGNTDALFFLVEDVRDELDFTKKMLPQRHNERISDEVESLLFLLGALKGEIAKLDDKIDEIEKKGMDEES